MCLRDWRGGFRADTRANVSILFGVSGVALMLVAGAAINLVEHNSAQARLQAASDAAALALASGNVQSAVGQAADRFITSNVADLNYVRDIATTASFDHASKRWTVTASGQVNYALPGFFQNDGVHATSIATASEPTALSAIKFQAGTAKGTFDKVVRLFAVFKEGDPPTEVWRMDYLYNGGSKDITMSSTTWVTVANAKALYLQMDINPDSLWFPEFGTYTTNRTDKPDLINYIKQGDTVLSQPLDLFAAAGCGEKKSYNWEDGGDFDYQDFTFEAIGQCSTATEMTGVRLVK
jgi:Flp pilus assembly protein TadG